MGQPLGLGAKRHSVGGGLQAGLGQGLGGGSIDWNAGGSLSLDRRDIQLDRRDMLLDRQLDRQREGRDGQREGQGGGGREGQRDVPQSIPYANSVYGSSFTSQRTSLESISDRDYTSVYGNSNGGSNNSFISQDGLDYGGSMGVTGTGRGVSSQILPIQRSYSGFTGGAGDDTEHVIILAAYTYIYCVELYFQLYHDICGVYASTSMPALLCYIID